MITKISIKIAGNIPASISFQSKVPPFALSLYSTAHIAISVAIVAPKQHCRGIGAYGVHITIDAIMTR
jgi:hypothetical protein